MSVDADWAIEIEGLYDEAYIAANLPPSAWFRAGDLLAALEDGDAVALWPDASGNGYDASGVGSVRPLLKERVLNGRPAVLFDGSDDHLDVAATLADVLGANGVGTIFVVAYPTTNTSRLVDSTNGAIRMSIANMSGNVLRARNDDGVVDTATKAATLSAWQTFLWLHDASNVYAGVSNADSSALAGTAVATGATTPLTDALFLSGSTTNRLAGYLAEVIFFNAALSETNRRIVARYLAKKYSLDDSSTAPVDMWTDVTRDVLLDAGLKVDWGCRESWPTGLTAGPGTLVDSKNNSEANSLGVRGLYTIGEPYCRPGFEYGARVRYKLNGNVRYLGRLDEAPATPGIYSTRDVRCRAVDYMDDLAKRPMRGIPTQTGLKAGQVLTQILDAMTVQPESRTIASGSDVYQYAFDQASDKAREEVDSVTQSEMGRSYILAGGFVFEDRGARRNRTSQFTLSPQYVDFDPGQSFKRENVKTRAEVTVHPRDVGAVAVPLYTHQDKTRIGPGQSIDIVARYVDPDQKAASIGGAGVAISGYTANTREDGAGGDMTASLTVAANPAFGGQEAPLRLTNGHATQWLYVTSLVLTGIPVRDLEQAKCSSVASEADLKRFGDNPVTIDMKYQGSVTFGTAVAAAVRGFMGRPRLWEGTFRFCANVNQDLMDLADAIDVSSCFTYDEGIVGSSDWIVNAVGHEYDPHGLLWVSLYCEPADLTHYWQAGVDAITATTPVPAPF